MSFECFFWKCQFDKINSLCIGAWDWNSSFLSHEVKAKSKIKLQKLCLGVAFSLFSFSLLFSSISCFVYQSYLGQHASLLAYTGYPVLCICMSLERSIDFPWISMCPSRTNLGKQTNKQTNKDWAKLFAIGWINPQILNHCNIALSCEVFESNWHLKEPGLIFSTFPNFWRF